jgi:Na+-translocating ferredoxin:NAD+ oxidoreductase RnfG subunit
MMTEEVQANESRGELARGILVLGAICLSSGLGIGLLYGLYKAKIEAKRKEAFNTALAVVLGEAEDYGTVGSYTPGTSPFDMVYRNESNGAVLYAAVGEAKGYQSTVRVLVSVKAREADSLPGPDLVVHRMAVFESQETPGLGDNINAIQKEVSIWGALAGQKEPPKRPWFQDQFTGKSLADVKIESSMGADKVSAVSGATVKSKKPAGKRWAGKGSGGAPIAAVTGATITSRAAAAATRNAIERIIARTAEVYGSE